MTYDEIAGLGTPESTWQAWPGLHELPSVAAGDVVPPAGRIIVLAPHPDDEVLGLGGLLAQLSAEHREILLLAVTDGMSSHPGSETWSPTALGKVRPQETAEALRRMDIDADVLRLGMPDAAVADFEEILTRHVTETLQEGDTVLATWRNDAHPDHEAVGRAAAAASEAAGATLLEVPVWMWHWAEPADPRVPWDRAVRVPMPAAVHEAKQHAVQAYASQISHDPALEIGAVLPQEVLDRLLRPYEVLLR